MEAQKKAEQSSSPMRLAVNSRCWPTDAAPLYFHSSAAASTAFQEYSELGKALLGPSQSS